MPSLPRLHLTAAQDDLGFSKPQPHSKRGRSFFNYQKPSNNGLLRNRRSENVSLIPGIRVPRAVETLGAPPAPSQSATGEGPRRGSGRVWWDGRPGQGVACRENRPGDVDERVAVAKATVAVVGEGWGGNGVGVFMRT